MVPVYKAEAGLEEALKNNKVVCNLEIHNPRTSDRFATFAKKFAPNPLEQTLDLFSFDSVLVTTCWNGNDDVFTKAEVWPAIDTPVNKQLNLGHNQDDIVGHITSSIAIDSDGEILGAELELSEVPDIFHVVTSAVVYTHWPNKEKQKAIAQLVADIREGKYYVSMECLFFDFDYVLKQANGSLTVVNRTEETAFLTKYLRAYGGEGVYEDVKVGRLPKRITFSGKGLVENPANPYSVIFSENLSKANKMEKTMEPNEKEVAELKAAVAKLEAEKSDLAKQLQAKAEADVAAKLTEKDNTITAKDAQIAELGVKLEAAIKDKNAAEEAKVAATKAHDELKAVVEKIQSEQKVNTRVAELEAVAESREEAIELEAKFHALDDEAFKGLLETLAAKKVKWSGKEKGVDNVEKTKAALEVIENAQTTEQPVAPNTETKPEQIQAALAKYISSTVFNKNKKVNKE